MLRLGFGRSSGREALDEEALLQQLSSLVPPPTLQALVGSSELPTGSEEERRRLLLRYLAAEKHAAAKAAKRLQQQAVWRQQFGTVRPEDVQADLAAGKVQLQQPIAGSGGRPLLVVKAARHRPQGDPSRLQRFIFFGLEAASEYCWHPRNPDGKMATLVGLELKHLDPAGLRAAFAVLNQHFPERVAHIWLLEAPTVFYGVWRLVEPFIDSAGRKKIRFVSGKAAKAALLEALGPDILPLEYGGTAAEMPLEVAVAQLATWRARHCGAAPQPALVQQQGQQGQQATEVTAGAQGLHTSRLSALSHSSPALALAATEAEVGPAGVSAMHTAGGRPGSAG